MRKSTEQENKDCKGCAVCKKYGKQYYAGCWYEYEQTCSRSGVAENCLGNPSFPEYESYHEDKLICDKFDGYSLSELMVELRRREEEGKVQYESAEEDTRLKTQAILAMRDRKLSHSITGFFGYLFGCVKTKGGEG